MELGQVRDEYGIMRMLSQADEQGSSVEFWTVFDPELHPYSEWRLGMREFEYIRRPGINKFPSIPLERRFSCRSWCPEEPETLKEFASPSGTMKFRHLQKKRACNYPPFVDIKRMTDAMWEETIMSMLLADVEDFGVCDFEFVIAVDHCDFTKSGPMPAPNSVAMYSTPSGLTSVPSNCYSPTSQDIFRPQSAMCVPPTRPEYRECPCVGIRFSLQR